MDYKIFEFNKHIKLENSKEKIVDKAELVRVAMLNLIKAKLSVKKSYIADDENEQSIQGIEKMNNKMKKWKGFSFDDIKGFCIKRENNNGK